jgi:hypothetical protein
LAEGAPPAPRPMYVYYVCMYQSIIRLFKTGPDLVSEPARTRIGVPGPTNLSGCLRLVHRTRAVIRVPLPLSRGLDKAMRGIYWGCAFFTPTAAHAVAPVKQPRASTNHTVLHAVRLQVGRFLGGVSRCDFFERETLGLRKCGFHRNSTPASAISTRYRVGLRGVAFVSPAPRGHLCITKWGGGGVTCVYVRSATL